IRCRVAIVQTEAINHFDTSRFREGKQAVNVSLAGQLAHIPVGCVAAEAQAPNSERMKKIDRRLIVRTEIMLSIRVSEQEVSFETQAGKIRRNRGARVGGVEPHGYR